MKRTACIPLAVVALSCDSEPAQLREWTPQDHKHTTQSGAQQKGQVTGDKKEISPGVDQVTVATWTSKCVLCHGRVGRGDGPQAAMFKPKDLTDPAWQASVSDEQILRSIQQGKGKMPGFSLPEKTARGLVRLVRLFNRDESARTEAASASTAASSTTPASTTAPAASATE